jgi:hypothetical protein
MYEIKILNAVTLVFLNNESVGFIWTQNRK